MVHPEWIDHNGHFNAGYYMVVFDDAITPWMRFVGLDPEHRESARVTTFSAENHITYVREVPEGAHLSVRTQLLAFDRKRIHGFQIMTNLDADEISATCEVMSLHISEDTRRVSEMADAVYERLEAIWEVHRHLPWPEQARRIMNVKGWEYP